ncbi:AAA family ATPase [Nocardiopsis sp. NPDC006198]|uniref:AAA family ATPase n=1 Tax=Nocardiopsis sp. NPDC006198 TaxID=3154472 RepID=UPI0033B5A667
MGKVIPIKKGPDFEAQIEYRLASQAGCGAGIGLTAEETNAQVEYRLKQGFRPIEWVGAGLSEFGIVTGTTLRTGEDYDRARALMHGRHAHTGERLIAPTLRVHPDAKLAARPLVEAVWQVAEAADMSPAELLGSARLEGGERIAKRFARLEKGVTREGDAHRAPYTDLITIAKAAGIDPSVLKEWSAKDVHKAKLNRNKRIETGNGAFDLILDLPKSFSQWPALADESMARVVEDVFMESVRETVTAVQGWVAYGMAGHHGDGRSAEKVDTSGLMGIITFHPAARPVDGQVGDPHMHVHVTIPNMVRCADGQWRTIAAGGRDLLRHAAPANAYLEARMRAKLRDRFAVAYMRDEHTRAWEIAPITAELRAPFSRRRSQIIDAVGDDVSRAHNETVAAQLAEAKQELTAEDVRARWRRRALDAGIDPEALVAAVLGGGGMAASAGGQGPLSPDDVARIVFDPDTGVTAHRKVARRTDVFRAVMDALPDGIADLEAAERLTDLVYASPYAVRLPPSGALHLSNFEPVTSVDIEQAERAIRAQARKRLNRGSAQVPASTVRRMLAESEAKQNFAFSPRQRQALERMLSAGHGVEALIGVAGAGKTTIMRTARQIWESQGLRVGGAATAAVAAANLHVEAGIDSRTVAGLLEAIKNRQGLGDIDVLVIDEGAMVDDRALARLLTAAADQGVKVVGIGDPKQLRAVGVGGGFAEIHRIVNGVTLDENMRQKVEVDRQALQTWREDTDQARYAALAQWMGAGRIHAEDTTDEARAAALAGWWQDTAHLVDPHQVIDQVLLLAGRNSDVEELNLRARSLFRLEGRLHGADVTFALYGGEPLTLARGDIVRVRANDYRSRRDPERADVLNGYRAVVREVNRRRGALIAWKRHGKTTEEWVSPEQLAAGYLSHGYAMTVAAAQGLTAKRAHVYGHGVDGHTLYSAMSRAEWLTRLYLPLLVLESVEARLAKGDPQSEQEKVQRAVAAFAATVNENDDTMVSEQIETLPSRGLPKAAQAKKEPGPQTRALLERREALASALAGLERVEEAAELVVNTTQQVRQLEAKAQQGLVTLALEGTSRAQVRTQVSHAQRTATVARERLDEARKQVRAAAAAAGVTADADLLHRAHEALVADWARLSGRAERADSASAGDSKTAFPGGRPPRPRPVKPGAPTPRADARSSNKPQQRR